MGYKSINGPILQRSTCPKKKVACIVGALANIGIAALTLPEARKAVAVIMNETSKAQ
jgi:hypothetical protein